MENDSGIAILVSNLIHRILPSTIAFVVEVSEKEEERVGSWKLE